MALVGCHLQLTRHFLRRFRLVKYCLTKLSNLLTRPISTVPSLHQTAETASEKRWHKHCETSIFVHPLYCKFRDLGAFANMTGQEYKINNIIIGINISSASKNAQN